MEEWVKLMDERFRKNNIPCVVIPAMTIHSTLTKL
jgi:hypothetical protein